MPIPGRDDCHSFMQRPVIWTHKIYFGRVEIWVDGSSEIIDIVSNALEMSVHGVTCVLVVRFRSKNTFRFCKLT